MISTTSRRAPRSTTPKTAVTTASKVTKTSARRKQKEVDENNSVENISPRVVGKKGKGKKKSASITSPVAAVATVAVVAEEEESPIATPTTPQKKKQQPHQPQQELTLSPTKSLARLTLFSDKSTVSSADANPNVNVYANVKAALFPINPAVKLAYKLIQKATGALGGNGTTGAIYGELTMHSMQKVINYMIENCELTSASRFIDVGSGLGKPNVHVAQDPCCRLSIGIELEEIRWQLAMQNMKYLVNEMSEDAHLTVHELDSDERAVKLVPGVNFLLGDIFDVSTLDPFTHIYMYDLGFPPPLQAKIAEHFNQSTHGRYLVSYRPPRRVIHEYGYAVKEIGKISTSMTGSGENHTAYFYKRINTPAPCRVRPNTTLLRIPPRPSHEGGEGEGELVVCSNSFLHCIQLAIGPIESCQAYVNELTSSHMESGRPKRERKPRNFFGSAR